MQVKKFLFRKNVLNVSKRFISLMDTSMKDFGFAQLSVHQIEKVLKKCLLIGAFIDQNEINYFKFWCIFINILLTMALLEKSFIRLTCPFKNLKFYFNVKLAVV